MRVVLAESFGMCFGVRDAVDLAMRQPDGLLLLGDLVHNPAVQQKLSEAGARKLAGAPVEPGSRVMITAHGISDRRRAELEAARHRIEDATCPLVRHAHRSLQRLVQQGYFPVLLGQPGHPEIIGLTEDLREYALVAGPSSLPDLSRHSHIGVISQTTQPVELLLETADAIRSRYRSAVVRCVDTVCQPTKDRQLAARRLGARCEVVLVIGGRHSNNTRQLLKACSREGARAHHIESVRDIDPCWLRRANGEWVSEIGLTAGTSTPDDVIHSVRAVLERLDQPLIQLVAAA